MNRIYDQIILDHVKNYRQMLFIMGPRQVGKTTKDMIQAPYAFQLSFNAPYVNKNCFEFEKPMIVPATTFLSQLI